MGNDLLYRVELEKPDGGRFLRSDGNKVIDFKFNHFNNDPIAIESICKQTFMDYSAISGTTKIDIEVSVLNSISNTYMVLYSYYGSEGRFVKHS